MFGRKFEKLLFKNTCAFVFPALAVFIVLVFMFMRYPIFDQAKSHDINDSENVYESVVTMYGMGNHIVEYTAKNLYYTGFDYKEDGKIRGSYYYTFDNQYIMLFLLDTTTPDEYIEEYTIKGSIVRNNVTVSHIMNKLTAETGIDEKLFNDYYFEYMISEPDYPIAFIGLVYLLFISPVVISVMIIMYAILMTACPSLHSQARQLEKYGTPSEIIKELNKELRYNRVFSKDNIYITDNYMVVSYFNKTDVIKLDMIKYLSKNLVENDKPFKKGDVYRLTMSDPETLFYEVDFINEELIDDVVRYVRGISHEERRVTKRGNRVLDRN